MADHAQTAVNGGLRRPGAAGAGVADPRAERGAPETAELAVAPTARAAGVYVLADGRRGDRAHGDVRSRLRDAEGSDVVAWLAGPDGKRARPRRDRRPRPLRRRGGGRGRRGAPASPSRGPSFGSARARGPRTCAAAAGTSTATTPFSVWAERDGKLHSHSHPDPLERLWSALTSVHAGDVLVSLAPGYETVDWGGMTHVGGGSHGALEAGDSLIPMLTVGFDDGITERREQWKLADAAGLIAEHFGLERPTGARGRQGRGMSTSDVFRRIHLGTRSPRTGSSCSSSAPSAPRLRRQPRRVRGAGRGPRRPPHPRRDRRLRVAVTNNFL